MRIARNGKKPVAGKFNFWQGEECTTFEFCRPSRGAIDELDIATLAIRELRFRLATDGEDIVKLDKKRQQALLDGDNEAAEKIKEKTKSMYANYASVVIPSEMLAPIDAFVVEHILSVSPLEAPDENGDLVKLEWKSLDDDEQLEVVRCLGSGAVLEFAEAIKKTTQLGAPAKKQSGRTSSSS